MPVEKDSKIAKWIAAIREGLPALRAHFDEWKDAVREEPTLIWATPAIRYTAYGLVGLIVVGVLVWSAGLFHPAEVAPPAETANFHVLCTAPGCAHHFVINREFDFDDFPVICPQCEQKTGQRAVRCLSKTCNGCWVVPTKRDHQYRCPFCGGYLGKVD